MIFVASLTTVLAAVCVNFSCWRRDRRRGHPANRIAKDKRIEICLRLAQHFALFPCVYKQCKYCRKMKKNRIYLNSYQTCQRFIIINRWTVGKPELLSQLRKIRRRLHNHFVAGQARLCISICLLAFWKIKAQKPLLYLYIYIYIYIYRYICRIQWNSRVKYHYSLIQKSSSTRHQDTSVVSFCMNLTLNIRNSPQRAQKFVYIAQRSSQIY